VTLHCPVIELIAAFVQSIIGATEKVWGGLGLTPR
jgi:hypothetical protein